MDEEKKTETPVEEKPATESEANNEAKPQDSTDKKEKKPKSKARRIIEWVITGFFAAVFVFAGVFVIDGMIHRGENYGRNVAFGYSTFLIETDSMLPEYGVNTAIVTHKHDCETIYQMYLKEETIDLTFFDNQRYPYVPTTGGITKWDKEIGPSDPTSPTNYPMTHRLREIQIDESKPLGEGRYIFFTSGTNKEGYKSQFGQYQTFTEKELFGVVILNSPVLGGILYFITTPWGLIVLLLIPASYLIVTSVLDIFKAVKEPEEGTSGGDNPNGDKKPGGSDPSSLDGFSEEEKKKLKQELLDEMMKKKGGK